MPENMTKKRKAVARKARRRRRQRRQLGLMSLFLLVCVGAFASLSLLNRRAPDRAETQQWYVADGEMQILAAPAAGTLDSRTGAASTLPFLAATAEPTAQPTAEPTPEPTAEPQGMHFFSAVTPPEESAAPMETLAPEATLAPGDAEITITAVGDCTLGGDIPTGAYKSFASYYDKYGPDYFFANVRELFASDDLTIVNLEGPLTTSEKIRGRKFNFRGLPEYVSILSGSSVEICNVANNHALDFGMDGLFVSNFVGKTPFAAINLVMPFLMILGGFGFMIGTGGSALVAKTMGAGDDETANRYFSMLIKMTLGSGLVLSILGVTLMEPISRCTALSCARCALS